MVGVWGETEGEVKGGSAGNGTERVGSVQAVGPQKRVEGVGVWIGRHSGGVWHGAASGRAVEGEGVVGEGEE